MSHLDRLLSRDGLPAAERLLVRMQASLWPGDHTELAECLAACRTRGVDRNQVEELLLQAVLFCGFPRVVNGFGVLAETWPAEAPRGRSIPESARREAGLVLFERIYADNATAVREMLRGYHEELHDFVIDTAYGRILCRDGIEPRVRELVAVGFLALTDQVPQMIAHGRGALRFGATAEQVREAIFTTTEDADLTARLSRRIG